MVNEAYTMIDEIRHAGSVADLTAALANAIEWIVETGPRQIVRYKVARAAAERGLILGNYGMAEEAKRRIDEAAGEVGYGNEKG